MERAKEGQICKFHSGVMLCAAYCAISNKEKWSNKHMNTGIIETLILTIKCTGILPTWSARLVSIWLHELHNQNQTYTVDRISEFFRQENPFRLHNVSNLSSTYVGKKVLLMGFLVQQLIYDIHVMEFIIYMMFLSPIRL